MPDAAVAELTNQDPAIFLAFAEEYREINERIAAELGERKDLRKRIKGAGFDLGAFDQAFKDSEKSGELRERKHREYLRNMAWFGKPVGFQAAMFDAQGEPTAAAQASAEVSEHQVTRVQDEARAAAVGGKTRQQNPWSPGSYLAQVWDDNYEAAAAANGADPDADDEALAGPPAPKRGRPPGSRDRTPRSRRGRSAA